VTMVAGKEVYRNGAVAGIDENESATRLSDIRTKIDSAATA